MVGKEDGWPDGTAVGSDVGSFDGNDVGVLVGHIVGDGVGMTSYSAKTNVVLKRKAIEVGVSLPSMLPTNTPSSQVKKIFCCLQSIETLFTPGTPE